ncbi:LLM class flavin-dependent oxidoreductase [Mucilaginibacter sp.]|uniref:LLM class flavin-dependent oxidoreductase n=1 Tax=Mucilaginibacter sp. TaxID=1882438 RepID=UPI0025F3399C|nr:LLM class flavin-dependent oxidoreductase [Mucilaginibacter sp.]
MKNPIKIGLLEFGDAPAMEHELATIKNVIEYAREADNLGFSRFWLAEHYDLVRPWYNPEVLIPIIAGMTNDIRVGAAGILLSVHSAYRVALSFKLLHNLFEERIDLGLARGLAAVNIAQALLSSEDHKDLQALKNCFNAKQEELYHILHHESVNLQNGLIVPPYKGTIPEVWSLGRSYYNLNLAVKCRNNFCLSTFHITLGEKHIELNKEKFQAYSDDFFEKHHERPSIAIAFEGICHKDDKRIKAIINAKNAGHLLTEPNYLIGPPSLFLERVNEMQEISGVDEFIFFNSALVQHDKLHAIEQLSDAFELSAVGDTSPVKSE